MERGRLQRKVRIVSGLGGIIPANTKMSGSVRTASVLVNQASHRGGVWIDGDSVVRSGKEEVKSEIAVSRNSGPFN